MLKTKIIVSGGNGFVGSYLEKYLLSSGCAVKLIDWRRFDGFETLKATEKKEIFVRTCLVHVMRYAYQVIFLVFISLCYLFISLFAGIFLFKSGLKVSGSKKL